jgi:membrane protease YdiL (CAAX protease family)
MAIRLVGVLTVEMLAYVLAGNTVFGIVAGYLYWTWGLETAILAHAGAHVVVFVGAILPVPF